MKRIPPVRGVDLEPNEWDEALMLVSSLEELAKFRAERLVKHYGPGPHPGTGTDQAIHGGGDSDPQPMLHDTMFGESPPNPKTKLTFTYDKERQRRAAEDYKSWENLFGREHPDLYLDSFEIEDQMVVRHAVEAWENFAGAHTLPEELEIRVSSDAEGALAWVKIDEPENANVLFIDNTQWNDEMVMDENVALLIEHPRHFASGGFVKAIAEDPDAEYGAAHFSYKTSVIFHELAHLAAVKQGWDRDNGRYWPIQFPYYSREWYPKQVTGSHPSLPSIYAAEHPAEYMAEALSDVWINGDDAAPLSKETFEVFKELTSQ